MSQASVHFSRNSPQNSPRIQQRDLQEEVDDQHHSQAGELEQQERSDYENFDNSEDSTVEGVNHRTRKGQFRNFHNTTPKQFDKKVISKLAEIRGESDDIQKALQLRNWFKTNSSIIRTYGFRETHISIIISILLQNIIPLKDTSYILRHLYPREKLQEDVVMNIVGKLSAKDNDINVMEYLLEWVVHIFEWIDSLETIRKFYVVLFHKLAVTTYRRPLSQLVYFLTRRKDVTPYRTRKLLELLDAHKEDIYIHGLLYVYHSFDNSIDVPVNVTTAGSEVFSDRDPKFNTAVRNVARYWAIEGVNDEELYKPEITLPNRKKAKANSETGIFDNVFEADPLAIEGILEKIESIPHHEQLSTALEDRKIQHMLACNPDDTAVESLGNLIGTKLMDLINYKSSSERVQFDVRDTLQSLISLTKFAKSQLPVVFRVLTAYLQTWNGIDLLDEIFELISYIKPDEYDVLYKLVLLPLYRKYYVMDATWKGKLIMCYTEWLKNWALLDWKRHTRQAIVNSENNIDDIDTMTRAFEKLSFNSDYFSTIQKLVEHVDRICMIGLLAENDHPLIQHASLSFFELVSSIPLQHDIPEIIIPAANFVHRQFFSNNAMAVSRICGIVCQYKKAFEENGENNTDWVSRHSAEYLNHFNTYMRDICNCLWRCKGLQPTEREDLAFSLTDEIIQIIIRMCEGRGDEINTTLSITHSGALAAFSKRFMMMSEEENQVEVRHYEPISVASLNKLAEQGGLQVNYLEYRVQYLNYLKEVGLSGIHDLLYECMTTLRRRREQELEQ